MARTIIQKYTTGMMKALLEQAKSIADLEHEGTKGRFRELFITEVLNAFLTTQFGTGTGTVINHKGVQSNQTDIIIYDKRILPPFIQEQDLAVYPAESVVATIEVKSHLDAQQLLKAEESARKLKKEVFDPEAILFDWFTQLRRLSTPLCAVFGFWGRGPKDLGAQDSGKVWLEKKVHHLFAICLANRYSWLRVGGKGWKIQKNNPRTNEEIKRFVAVLLDNVRTHAERRFRVVANETHKDWLTAYIRN